MEPSMATAVFLKKRLPALQSTAGKQMGILCKSVRKCPDFHTIWIFYADGKPVSQLFSYPFLQFWSELLCGVLSAGNKSGEF